MEAAYRGEATASLGAHVPSSVWAGSSASAPGAGHAHPVAHHLADMRRSTKLAQPNARVRNTGLPNQRPREHTNRAD